MTYYVLSGTLSLYTTDLETANIDDIYFIKYFVSSVVFLILYCLSKQLRLLRRKLKPEMCP